MQLSAAQLFSIASFLAFGVKAQDDAIDSTGLIHLARYTNSSQPITDPTENTQNSTSTLTRTPETTASVTTLSISSSATAIPQINQGHNSSRTSTGSESITSPDPGLTSLPKPYNSTSPTSNTTLPAPQLQGHNSTEISNTTNPTTGSAQVGFNSSNSSSVSAGFTGNGVPSSTDISSHFNSTVTINSTTTATSAIVPVFSSTSGSNNTNTTSKTNGSSIAPSTTPLPTTPHSNSAIIYPSSGISYSVTVGEDAFTRTQSAEVSTGLNLIPFGGQATVNSTITGTDASTRTQIAEVSTGVNLVPVGSQSVSNSTNTSVRGSTITDPAKVSTSVSVVPFGGNLASYTPVTGTVASVQSLAPQVSTGESLSPFGGNLASYTPVTGTVASVQTLAAQISTDESLSALSGGATTTATVPPLSTEISILGQNSTKIITITSCSEGPCYPSSTAVPITEGATSSTQTAYPAAADVTKTATQIEIVNQLSSSNISIPEIQTVNVASQPTSTQPAVSVYDGSGSLIRVETVLPLALAFGMVFI